MEKLLGPVLRLRGYDAASRIWQVSALVVTTAAAGEAAPAFSCDINGTKLAVTSQAIGQRGSATVWRYDMDVALQAGGQTVTYAVAGGKWHFQVPALDAQPLLAYVSCNGFSDPKLMRSVSENNAMWTHLTKVHATTGYHVLLMGGDQTYADEMWARIEALREWAELDFEAGNAAEFTATMRAELDRLFFETLYCKRWSQPEVAEAVATIPTVMMWDDHDIMDGWGSYDDARQASPVFQGIFRIARHHFEVFQLQGTAGGTSAGAPARDPVYVGPPGTYHQLYRLGPIALLVLDLRSQRSQTRVVAPDAWNQIYAALDSLMDGADKPKHLLVMSSIPVVHAQFSVVESALGFLPGQQELEDDLRDHWSSPSHTGERYRLVHRLLDLSAKSQVRVTVVSGDVHVAACGAVTSNREAGMSNAQVITQLTSSAIVHPAPGAIAQLALNNLFETEEVLERGIVAAVDRMPGDQRRFIAARNWLAVEADNPGNLQNRLWVKWHIERMDQPLLKVIHPV